MTAPSSPANQQDAAAFLSSRERLGKDRHDGARPSAGTDTYTFDNRPGGSPRHRGVATQDSADAPAGPAGDLRSLLNGPRKFPSSMRWIGRIARGLQQPAAARPAAAVVVAELGGRRPVSAAAAMLSLRRATTPRRLHEDEAGRQRTVRRRVRLVLDEVLDELGESPIDSLT